MDLEHTQESQDADALLDNSLAQETTGSTDRQAAFMQQLADFEATAETNSSPLGGALVLVLADTMIMSRMLSDAVRRALPETPELDDLERVKGPMNDFFKAARQIDRFANIGLRSIESCSRSADARQTKRADGRVQGGDRHFRKASQFHD
jgi:hypothetical protein